MKVLNQHEIVFVSGGINAKTTLGIGGVVSGAAVGGYYGAMIAGPLALCGAMLAITNSGILWEAVALCATGFVGAVSAGAAIGAVTVGIGGFALGAVADVTIR